jgi:hypothetical protein
VVDARSATILRRHHISAGHTHVILDLGPSLLWIPDYVRGLLRELVLIAIDPIEGFLLPDLAESLVLLLHPASGEGFPGMKNLP